jgi:uncharacterized protein (DUF2267 family)
MPVPSEYQRASIDFERFLVEARDNAGLATTNQSYTMAQAVLLVFRRRLSVQQAIDFAQVLPPVLRAIFVSDWDTAAPRADFADRATLVREVQSVRPQHNFAPDSAIDDVATALRRQVHPADFERVLSTLPEAARRFWSGDAA